jgi:SAM-dependent methyltransferase
MSPIVYSAIEQICAGAEIAGRVLEVGTVPGPDCLLRMPCLSGAVERVGINLDVAEGLVDGNRMVRGNANDMRCFPDRSFNAVLSNATLEHDPYFWKTVAEIHRVAAPGAFILIGVPGYVGMGPGCFSSPGSWAGRLTRIAAACFKPDVLLAGTVTLGEHFYPGDYYRFSVQAVKEVFLGGLDQVSTRIVMNPPRIIGWGRKR